MKTKIIYLLYMMVYVFLFQSCDKNNKNLDSIKNKAVQKKYITSVSLDPNAPVLTVNSPAFDEVLSDGSVAVSITSDRLTDYIYINDQPMATTDNINFTFEYEIPYDGKYKLRAVGAVNGHQSDPLDITFDVFGSFILILKMSRVKVSQTGNIFNFNYLISMNKV